jgi:GntR family transcriptional regulator of arabinose operon
LKELGIRVPEDVSILCFDSPADYLGQYDFTHLRQNESEMGVLAMDMLNEIIEGESRLQKSVLPVELIEGNSVRSII